MPAGEEEEGEEEEMEEDEYEFEEEEEEETEEGGKKTICPECGEILPADEFTCPSCGYDFEGMPEEEDEFEDELEIEE
jgi:rubrerythrin